MIATALSFQRVITALAAKHGLDLTANEAHLRLEMPPYMPLVVEKIGRHLVSVAHYYYQNGDAIADPDVVCFTGYPVGWIPTQITQPPLWFLGRAMGGTRDLALLNDDASQILRYSPPGVSDVAEFCATWAENIRDQGWLTDGAKAP